jgi:putative transposase
LREATHLIHDRDPLYTQAWAALLQTGGVKGVPIPAQSPNCNPHAERFVQTVRTECLDHFVIFGERHLRHLVEEFMGHLTDRHHQGIGSQIIMPKALPSNDNATLGAIGHRSRLGGLLNYYCREAASCGDNSPDTTGSNNELHLRRARKLGQRHAPEQQPS